MFQSVLFLFGAILMCSQMASAFPVENNKDVDLFITKERAHEFLVPLESQPTVTISSHSGTDQPLQESRVKRDIDRGYHEILQDEQAKKEKHIPAAVFTNIENGIKEVFRYFGFSSQTSKPQNGPCDT